MEAAVLLSLQSIRVVGLTQVMALVYALGASAFVWVVLAVVMLMFADKRQTGMLVIAAVVVAGLASALVIAPLVGRARPFDAGIGVTVVVGVSKAGYGFPCARAATSFAAAVAIAFTLGRRFGVPAVLGAVLISFSCLYLGVNYPSDVLAGALLGVVAGVIVVWLYNTFFRERFIASVGSGARPARKSVKRRG